MSHHQRHHLTKTIVCRQQQQHYHAASSDTSNNNSTLPKDIADIVNKYAHMPQTSASLQMLLRSGRGEFLNKTFKDDEINNQKYATQRVLIQAAGFIRHEIPIRLAHRILDLDNIPLLRSMPSVQNVKQIYIDSLLTLIETDVIDCPATEEAFAETLSRAYERHQGVLIQMARGAFELREEIRRGGTINGRRRGAAGGGGATTARSGVTFEDMEDTHQFLDRFYMSRIGIRVLAGQYLALREPFVDNWVGLICQNVSPKDIVLRAAEDATMMCCRKYGDAPTVNVSGQLDLTFPYVPDHLHYILLELVKNSMRATVDWHGVDNDFPPIEVIIADGKENEDVVIKVSDKGGGITRTNMKKIWSYLFTTADPVIQEGMVAFNSRVDHSVDSPLAGLGYGLPISRSYARYFGGDLSVMSMEGYGTDAFVYLTRLGDKREPLYI